MAVGFSDTELAQVMLAASQIPQSKRREFLECVGRYHEQLHTDIGRAIALAAAYVTQQFAGTAA